MDHSRKKELLRLLDLPSPSGFEAGVQKLFLRVAQESSDEVFQDNFGDVAGVFNPDNPFKVLLAAHCDEIGFMISRIEEDGFLRVKPVGDSCPRMTPGMRLRIFGRGSRPVFGVVGIKARHHGGVPDRVDMDDLFVDIGAESFKRAASQVETGDYAVYDRAPSLLGRGLVTGRGLDNRGGTWILMRVMEELASRRPKVGVVVASTVCEETNLSGAYAVGTAVRPNVSIVVDATFATDHPSADLVKHGDIRLGLGPAIARGSAVSKKVSLLLEAAADRVKVKRQREILPASTGTDADRIMMTSGGVPTGLLSLPVRYMHSPVETAALSDLDDSVSVLCEFLRSIGGDENLDPLAD